MFKNIQLILFSCWFILTIQGQQATIEKGNNLFSQNCASCHHPTRDYSGPALKPSLKKGSDWFIKYSTNTRKFIASGNKKAKKARKKNSKKGYPPYDHTYPLNAQEVTSIMSFIESKEKIKIKKEKKDLPSIGWIDYELDTIYNNKELVRFEMVSKNNKKSSN